MEQQQGRPVDSTTLLQVYKSEHGRILDENMMLKAYIGQLEAQLHKLQNPGDGPVNATPEDLPEEA
jgi:hypothetical protein